MIRETKSRWALELLFLLLALLGFSLNLLLLVRRLSDGAGDIAGCGTGACDELLASRWSAIAGMPVTLFGSGTYFLVIASSIEAFRRWQPLLLGLIVGAACWFVFVQGVILKSFCPWCLACHGVGLAVAVTGVVLGSSDRRNPGILKRSAAWTVAAFLGIGLAQVYGPVPSARIVSAEIPPLSSTAGLIAGNGRTVRFSDGGKSYQVSLLPRRGRAGAKHVLVEYFDYHCPACRMMAGFLDGLMEKHPAEIAVLLLPVPMDRPCNAHISADGEHPGSCETTRIALAVWRMRPDAFENFHHRLINEPSPVSARRLALELVSADRLEAALADPWIDGLIRADVEDWRALSKSTDKLPKLLIRDRRILHGLPSGREDFIRVMEKELGL